MPGTPEYRIRVTPAVLFDDALKLRRILGCEHVFKFGARLCDPAEVQARAGQHYLGLERCRAVRTLVETVQLIRSQLYFFKLGLHDIQRLQTIEHLRTLRIVPDLVA